MNRVDPVIDSLTPAQCEVLEMVFRRMTSKEIARELGITHQSVDKRIDAARAKLSVSTRAEAARIYAEARYGESLPAELFPVTPETAIDPLPDRASNGDSGGEGLRQLRGALRLDPERIGPLGRLGLILAGAIAFALLVLILLGIASGAQTLVGG